jgi:hypothetical protein
MLPDKKLFIAGKRKEKKEAKMSNVAGKVVGGIFAATLFGSLIYAGVHASNASNTADKLTYDIDGVGVKELLKSGILPTGVIYTFTFKVTNPTSTPLTISNLDVILSIRKKNGEIARIANSQPSAEEQTIAANGQTKIKHDIEVRFANVLPVLPNFLTYVIGRLRGGKSTQEVIADISVDSMGLTIPITENIAI